MRFQGLEGHYYEVPRIRGSMMRFHARTRDEVPSTKASPERGLKPPPSKLMVHNIFLQIPTA